MVLCVFYLYISFCKHKVKDDEWVNVSFFDKKCLGFIDTGNKVFYKGYPVIFISKKLIGEYEVIDKIDIETASQKETIDLTVFKEIEINHQKLHHVYVGILYSNEYDCILNSQLLGGLL
ncbi:MAG: hypothetical protein RR512_06380 [Coprobacillus sp.]